MAPASSTHRGPKLSASALVSEERTAASLQHSSCYPPALGHALQAAQLAQPGPWAGCACAEAQSVQDLALNGCKGVTDELFASLEHAGRPLPLHTLSAKHTRGLHTCWLGLAPAAAGGRCAPGRAAGWWRST